MHYRYPIASNRLEFLRHSLGLPAERSGWDSVRDVLFVSIDFENGSSVKSTQAFQGQLGIAVLDTRDLRHSSSSSPSIESMITTYNFVIGPSSYCALVNKKFLFGKTITISQQEMISKLEAVIPRTRDIILVGHDFGHDLRVLRHLNFDTRTSILGIFDTMKIAREVIPASPGTLRGILTELQCPFNKLHSAGNDANFTLRAWLLLAVQNYVVETLRLEDKQTVEVIRGIARFNLPTKPDPNERARRKRRKRFEKFRKQVSKSWDIDTQERIRAERAAKRVMQENNSLQFDIGPLTFDFIDRELVAPVV